MRLNDRDRGKPASLAPQIRGGGIGVLKDDRCALTFIDTGHAHAFDFEKILRANGLLLALIAVTPSSSLCDLKKST
jgi:hypothetical protein